MLYWYTNNKTIRIRKPYAGTQSIRYRVRRPNETNSKTICLHSVYSDTRCLIMIYSKTPESYVAGWCDTIVLLRRLSISIIQAPYNNFIYGRPSTKNSNNICLHLINYGFVIAVLKDRCEINHRGWGILLQKWGPEIIAIERGLNNI
jgi:hypothetical protein